MWWIVSGHLGAMWRWANSQLEAIEAYSSLLSPAELEASTPTAIVAADSGQGSFPSIDSTVIEGTAGDPFETVVTADNLADYGGGGDDGGTDTGGGSFEAREEEEFQEAFQRGLRTQFPTGQFDRMQGTTAGRTLQREFNPYQAAFFGQELALGARDPKPFAGTEEPGAFERFVTSQPVGSLRGRVGQSWRDIQRSAAKSPNDPGVAQFINPEGISQANILRGVARQQFVDRYGDYLGNIFAPKPLRSAELLGRFRGQRGTTGGHESYLAWLAQRFGTGNPAGTG